MVTLKINKYAGIVERNKCKIKEIVLETEINIKNKKMNSIFINKIHMVFLFLYLVGTDVLCNALAS